MRLRISQLHRLLLTRRLPATLLLQMVRQTALSRLRTVRNLRWTALSRPQKAKNNNLQPKDNLVKTSPCLTKSWLRFTDRCRPTNLRDITRSSDSSSKLPTAKIKVPLLLLLSLLLLPLLLHRHRKVRRKRWASRRKM